MRNFLALSLVSASLVLLATGTASAAPREVAPLPTAECEELAKVLSKRLAGMTISVSTVGNPSQVLERLKVSGTGCELTGTKTGMPRNFYFDTLSEPYFKDWEQALPAAADGPYGGTFGFFKGPKVVIYDLHYDVPEKLCKSAKDLEACESKYQKQWVYQFRATAFGFVDGKPLADSDFGQ